VQVVGLHDLLLKVIDFGAASDGHQAAEIPAAQEASVVNVGA